MANQYGQRVSQYSYACPAPVAWTPDREARGAAPPRGPRCPHPSCPVRYVSGESRPCPEHAAPRPELTGAQRAMVRAVLAVARTPGRRRVVRALLADAARSNRVVARATATDHMCVRRVRHAMEAAGVITAYRAPSRPVTARAAPGRDRARAALLRDPARSNRAVAAEAAISYPVVMHARHAMEAAGLIAVYRARPWSASQQPAN